MDRRTRRRKLALGLAVGLLVAGGIIRRRRAPTTGRPCFACLYDGLARLAERRELGRRRDEIVGRATGTVLDLGSGTGENFKHYRAAANVVVAAEPDPDMRRWGRRRSAESHAPVHHVAAAGERLPFRDGAIDTIVATLVLCSVDDPEAAVAEMRRVLAPGGRVLVLEHIRAGSPRLARWQDRLQEPWSALAGGCHPNRDTAEVLDRHGFDTAGLDHFELHPSIPLVAPHMQGATSPR